MAQGKKISELNEVSSVTDNDEFLFVDKEGSGANSGVGGKTAKIKFSDLKSAIGAGSTGAKGASGDKGMKGELVPRGLDGAGTQYWTQSPTDGDAVYYDSGKVGIGTDSPTGDLQVHSNSSSGTNFYLTNGFDSNTNSHWRMQADYDGTFNLGMFSSSFYKRLTISPEGNVGIGTDTPSSALDIKSTQTTGNFELNIRVDNTEFEKYSRVLVGTGAGRSVGLQAFGNKYASTKMPLFHTPNSVALHAVSHQMTFDLMGPYADKKISFVVSDNEADDSYSADKSIMSINKSGVAIGTDSYETLTGGSKGYKLVVSDDTSTGTSILLHNSYEDATHSSQTWRMIADPSKKHFAIGQQGSSFYPRLKLHSGELGGFTFGEDGNGAKENFSTIRFPRTGIYPSLDLIRNEVINELTSKNYIGSGTVIQFGALKNDLDENYDPIKELVHFTSRC